MKITAFALAVLAVGALSAPHQAGRASCHDQKSTCLRLQRAVDAFSGVMQSPNVLKAREESGQVESEPALTAKRGISELATLMAMTADDPEDFLKRMGVEPDVKSGEEHTKVKRVAAPKPWCYQRRYTCWKRDLLNLKADKKKRETDAASCWHPGNLCWRAKQAADAVLNAARPDGDSTKSADKREAECGRPEDLCKASKRDLDAVQAAARRISSSLK